MEKRSTPRGQNEVGEGGKGTSDEIGDGVAARKGRAERTKEKELGHLGILNEGKRWVFPKREKVIESVGGAQSGWRRWGKSSVLENLSKENRRAVQETAVVRKVQHSSIAEKRRTCIRRGGKK